jgi:hypothetical protein
MLHQDETCGGVPCYNSVCVGGGGAEATHRWPSPRGLDEMKAAAHMASHAVSFHTQPLIGAYLLDNILFMCAAAAADGALQDY